MTKMIFDDDYIAAWSAALDDRPREVTELEIVDLAACILSFGEQAGWLNAEADVIKPPMPPLDG